MEIGMPYDYDPTASDPTIYEYPANVERMFNVAKYSNGVFPKIRIVDNNILEPTAYIDECLRVTPSGNGLSINIAPGIAHVEGVFYMLTETKQIALSQNIAAQTYDIVIDNTLTNQTPQAIAQLRASEATLEESLIRNESIYQICIATINIPANATTITSANILDQRLNTNVASSDNRPICGLVGSSMQADTRVIYSALQSQLEENRTFFDTWFASVQDTLDGDTAGNLYNLITGMVHTTNNVQVTNTGWIASGDFYYKDVADAWFTGADNETVDVYPTLESEDAAMVLKKRADTFNGGFRLWSNEIPEDIITIDYKGQRQVT